MKKVIMTAMAVVMILSVVGCAKKTASEQLSDDMKKMQTDMNKSAKKVQADLK